MPLDPQQRRVEGSWQARPVVAGALRLLILLVPIGVSFAATVAIRRLVPEPQAGIARALWWVALVVSALWVAVIVERAARRLLPLVTLLKLGMLFPDRAPSRFAIAREAGSTRRLEERLAHLEDDPGAANESSSAKTILALIVALQNHDRKTRGHAERVRVYTDLLAEELHLPAEDRYRLRWAALLHDIGKLSVKARILNKPGSLDAREWDEMRKHPADGARIAGSLLGWLGPWGLAISQHHERIDGEGYPAAIPGDRISIAARIVSVADAYDTMTAARTYRKPLAVRAARQELADCAGTQFDREIVRAFFAISLPRLLWKTGPVSLLFHLPYLRQLEVIGRQSLAAAGHTVTAATVAASVTALSVGAPLSASAAPAPVGSGRSVSIEVPSHDRAGSSPSGMSADEANDGDGGGSSISAEEQTSAVVESTAGVAGSRGDVGIETTVGDDDADADSEGVQDEDQDDRDDESTDATDADQGESDGERGRSDADHGNGNGNGRGNGEGNGANGNGNDGSNGNGNDGSNGNGESGEEEHGNGHGDGDATDDSTEDGTDDSTDDTSDDTSDDSTDDSPSDSTEGNGNAGGSGGGNGNGRSG